MIESSEHPILRPHTEFDRHALSAASDELKHTVWHHDADVWGLTPEEKAIYRNFASAQRALDGQREADIRDPDRIAHYLIMDPNHNYKRAFGVATISIEPTPEIFRLALPPRLARALGRLIIAPAFASSEGVHMQAWMGSKHVQQVALMFRELSKEARRLATPKRIARTWVALESTDPENLHLAAIQALDGDRDQDLTLRLHDGRVLTNARIYYGG